MQVVRCFKVVSSTFGEPLKIYPLYGNKSANQPTQHKISKRLKEITCKGIFSTHSPISLYTSVNAKINNRKHRPVLTPL